MSTHDLDQLRRWLRVLPDVAQRTEHRLEDLHTLAYDRHVGDHGPGRGGTPAHELDPLVGSPAAKELWRRAARAIHTACIELEAVSVGVGKLLNHGDPADNTLRGTMLGDDLCRCGHEARCHEPHCTSATGPTIRQAKKTVTPTCDCQRYNPKTASDELAERVDGQKRAAERGEYVPNREMAQPKVPRR